MQYEIQNKGNSTIVVLIVLVILIVAGAWYYKGAKTQKEALEGPLPSMEEEQRDAVDAGTVVEIGAEDKMLAVPGDGSADDESVVEAQPFKEFDVEGRSFEFSVKDIRVSRGDFVRINFKSTGGFHDWKVDEFNASTRQVNTGESASVDFTADKTGTFEFYCSVGSHRQLGMVGKLIVE